MDDINAQIRAKIPGADTGIEIRHTLCDICTPQMHCGLDVYVKDPTPIWSFPADLRLMKKNL